MEGMGIMRFNEDFYRGKKVLITGHTGFKGSWLCKMLSNMGATVIGYALEPMKPSLFEIAGIGENIRSEIGDVRDFSHLKEVFETERPEIVLHLAAQPIVRESYVNPRGTYETNVMGTVNLLECVRLSESVKSVLNVTTDKVYHNNEWEWGYREDDPLDGYDPYSNSKSCSELVTHSYKRAFFDERKIPVSTARAGNVIGGGDFAKDRIIPDCVRAMQNQEKIIVRNPNSVRPYQHVLEPLSAYLTIAQYQAENFEFAGYYNVGPDDKDCITTGEIVQLFCDKWGESAEWVNQSVGGPHEANFLKLDCSRMKKKFGWRPVWSVEQAVEKSVEWTKAYLRQEDIKECMDKQIQEFLNPEGE